MQGLCSSNARFSRILRIPAARKSLSLRTACAIDICQSRNGQRRVVGVVVARRIRMPADRAMVAVGEREGDRSPALGLLAMHIGRIEIRREPGSRQYDRWQGDRALGRVPKAFGVNPTLARPVGCEDEPDRDHFVRAGQLKLETVASLGGVVPIAAHVAAQKNR